MLQALLHHLYHTARVPAASGSPVVATAVAAPATVQGVAEAAPAVQGVDSLDACSVGQALRAGDSGIGAAVDAFQGQMGSIYLFDDCITARERASMSVFLFCGRARAVLPARQHAGPAQHSMAGIALQRRPARLPAGQPAAKLHGMRMRPRTSTIVTASCSISRGMLLSRPCCTGRCAFAGTGSAH